MSRTLVRRARLRWAVPVLAAAVLASSAAVATPALADTPSERPAPTLPAGPDRATAPDAAAADAGRDIAERAAGEAETAQSPTRTVSAAVVTDDGAHVVSVEVPPSQVDRAMVDLRKRPGVVAVDVDARVSADEMDEYRWDQWGLDTLNMEAIPPGTADDSALKIAVVDSGVYAAHEDLAGRVRCDLGADFVANSQTSGGDGCVDPAGHGTHVAGQIAAITDNGLGIAGVSNAEIIPVRVLGANGWGDDSGIAHGIYYAVDAGAAVINLSLGSDTDNDVMKAAVQYALDHDVVVVASAGNDRQEGNVVHYPAAYPGVFSVAASDDEGLSSYYSNSNPATNVFITAPGSQIVSTSHDGPSAYGWKSGTSMAAPHVAGIVSRYRALHPTATVADVRAAVQATAIDMERLGKDATTGYGMIDALELLTGQDAPTPWAVPTPAAVTITGATAGNGAVSVRWAAPTYGGTSAVTGYALDTYRWNGSTREWDYLSETAVASTARSATVAGLRNGATHVVVIWPRNAYGWGQSAETLEVTPLAPIKPGAPKLGTISPVAGGAVVRWTAAADNRSAIRSYTVRAYRGTAVVKSVTAGGTATSVTVPGLANGTGYTFNVTATNGVGAGPASARSAVVVPRTKPGAPGIGTPTAGAGSATVRWSAPSSIGGATITSYTIRAYKGTTLVKTVTASGAARAVVVPGLANGSAHTFVVYATNAAGSSPASARSVAVVPRAKPGAPALGAVTPGNGSAVIRWSSANDGGSAIRSYVVRVYRGTTVVKTATLAATARAVTVTGLANGVVHTFTVTATNALGAGPASATGTVTPRTVPGAARDVVAVAGDASATVQWTAPASDGGAPVTGFVVRAYQGTTQVQVVTVAGDASGAVVTGLTNGVAYTFTVTATNAAGSGPASARSAAVTPLA